MLPPLNQSSTRRSLLQVEIAASATLAFALAVALVAVFGHFRLASAFDSLERQIEEPNTTIRVDVRPDRTARQQIPRRGVHRGREPRDLRRSVQPDDLRRELPGAAAADAGQGIRGIRRRLAARQGRDARRQPATARSLSLPMSSRSPTVRPASRYSCPPTRPGFRRAQCRPDPPRRQGGERGRQLRRLRDRARRGPQGGLHRPPPTRLQAAQGCPLRRADRSLDRAVGEVDGRHDRGIGRRQDRRDRDRSATIAARAPSACGSGIGLRSTGICGWRAVAERSIFGFAATSDQPAVSGMWRATTTGTAVLRADVVKDAPFVGVQSQRLTFAGGEGEAGIENRGLNRRGMAFVAGKPYEGYLWLRAEKPIEIAVSLEGDAGASLAKSAVKVSGDGWRRYDFTLTPTADAAAGRFAVRLLSPGTVDVGHAFLQPGEWGRFRKLPVRRDVVRGAEGPGRRGICGTAAAWSMLPATSGRTWSARATAGRRTAGHWYPYSTNGWGILGLPRPVRSGRLPGHPRLQHRRDAGGSGRLRRVRQRSADSPWGRKRADAGHPAPYRLGHIELGNEEKVDAAYVARFEKLARAIWAKDPDIILIVGDFQYERPIADPAKLSGAASGITSLDGHRRILEIARRAGREVWFDVHVWTEGPGLSAVGNGAPQLHRCARPARGRGQASRRGVRVQRQQSRSAASAGQRRHDRPIDPGRTRADRPLGQRPAAGRPERQRLGPGPAVPQPDEGLAAAPGLRDADGRPRLPVADGRRLRQGKRHARSDGHAQRGRQACRAASGQPRGDSHSGAIADRRIRTDAIERQTSRSWRASSGTKTPRTRRRGSSRDDSIGRTACRPVRRTARSRRVRSPSFDSNKGSMRRTPREAQSGTIQDRP